MTQESFTLRNNKGTSVALAVMEHDGLGVAQALRAAQNGPYQHGQSLLTARLMARTVTLKVVLNGLGSEETLRTDAGTLAQMMNRLNTPLYLDTVLPDGTTRRLDCYLNSGLTYGRKAGEMKAAQIDVLQLIADNPVAYDPSPTSVVLGLSGGGTGLPIPMLVPFTLGASVLDESFVLTYLGTWQAYPQIHVLGPIDDCVITNATTGEKLDFTGFDLGAGEYIDIDCRYGYKTVTGDATLGDLTTDSNMATFHIAPADEATDGINSFTVTGSSVTGDTEITITYNTRYLSVL
jgi:hypothetical protein